MAPTHMIRPALAASPSPPAERDAALDVARAAALAVVVVWHWVFSTVSVGPDGPHVGNPIPVIPGGWALTWILQVMPLFFLVGGAVHAAALDRRGPHGFISRRLRRLVLPALPLAVPAAVAWGVAAAAGLDAVARTIVLVGSPLWFAATYSALVVVAPTAWRAQRRWPLGTPITLALAVIAVDTTRFVVGWTHPLFVIASFVVVWAAVHHLGFAWLKLREAPLGRRVWVAIMGYAGVAACVTVLGYPSSMVGVPGKATSNMAPPDAAIVFLAVAQLGLLSCAAGAAERFAKCHPRLIAKAADWSMTVFVWHLLAWLLAYGAVRSTGVDVPGDVTPAWWIQRPLWLVLPGVIAVPLCILCRRFDSSGAALTGFRKGHQTGRRVLAAGTEHDRRDGEGVAGAGSGCTRCVRLLPGPLRAGD